MSLPVGPIHHLRLTVTDVELSKAFYTEVLGFRTRGGAIDRIAAVALLPGRCPAPET